eukprot:Seg522.3 transcript_id=Seg522.3/GoldUCD/mRNA.D3Y31 product="hypothetical protein" protein_id=Seg522.3/GoldUCD/D3Y31
MADGGGEDQDGFVNKVRLLNARVSADLNRRLKRREIQAQLSEASSQETVTANTLMLCSTFALSRTATSRTPRTRPTRATPPRPGRYPDESDTFSYSALGSDHDSDTEMSNSHSEEVNYISSHFNAIDDSATASIDRTNNETSGCPRPTPSTGSTDVSLFLKKVLKQVFATCMGLSGWKTCVIWPTYT